MIDLHLHSSCSDGSERPERIVELAHEAGCSAIALTDHDTIAGVAAAQRRGGELGLEVIAGCEISSGHPAGSMHLLCHFLDDPTSPLVAELTTLSSNRVARNVALAARLTALGLPISYAEVLAEGGRRPGREDGIGRPHFAAVLVRNGAADSIGDAFARYLGPGAPGYVGIERITATEVIALARRSGAVVTLAHPLSLGLTAIELDKVVGALARSGLVGLESYYGRYDQAARDELAALAARHGLVATGGSDFHGSYKPDLSVGTGRGELRVDDAILAVLRGRRP